MSSSVYEEQLETIKQALLTCNNDDDRANLISLQQDLQELISLENLESKSSDDENCEDENETEENFDNEKKELYQHLINEKCRAPFITAKGQSESFHNAFIADVLADDDDEGLIVKVFFLNPTLEKMKACDYYFSHRCTFESNCKYSHGETVKYSKLKQYQEPNYSLLKRKSHVLVKTESLWKPGLIMECSQDLKTCQVKLHGGGKTMDCPFSDVLPPLETQTSDSSDLSTDEGSDEEDYDAFPSRNVLQIGDNFGEWEKHTTGIGSKILQKYGYVSGNGLGKRSDGITQPISAKMYVQGKSLDYNMELNERKGRATVEENSRRESLKQQKISERNYANQHEIFDFLNNSICNIKPSTSATATITKPENVKSQSKTQLNISNFKLEEDIKKIENNLKNLKQSQGRLSKDSVPFTNLQRQIVDRERSLEHLQKTLHEVNKEQTTRREKNKLTVF